MTLLHMTKIETKAVELSKIMARIQRNIIWQDFELTYLLKLITHLTCNSAQ